MPRNNVALTADKGKRGRHHRSWVVMPVVVLRLFLSGDERAGTLSHFPLAEKAEWAQRCSLFEMPWAASEAGFISRFTPG